MLEMPKGLSTGSTLLNLALTGDPFKGFVAGKYFFIVGDSASGKTFLSMTCLAEATIDPNFSEYDFIYDNIEDGMLMDLDTLFNDTVADRIRPPAMKGGEPAFSDSVESFYYNLDDAIGRGKPFIYILDSMDALDTDAADKKFQQHKKAYRKKRGDGDEPAGGDDDKLAGSYGDGKAKKNSEFLRKAMKGLKATGSILIILSQTRDNIGSMFGGKTRAGGHALRFYATTEFWSSIIKPIKKTVHDIERKVGNRIKLAFRKNRFTGQLHEVEIDIYPSFGIDDVGSCVDYLVGEGYWSADKQTITATGLDTGLDVVATRDKLIRTIERKGLERRLRELCGTCWAEVEAACSLKRKNRYAPGEEPV